MEIRMPCHSAPLFPSSLHVQAADSRAQTHSGPCSISTAPSTNSSILMHSCRDRGTPSFCSRIRDVLSELDHNPGPLNVNGVDHKRGIRWLLKMLGVLD